ncbi:MAG: hypothetical protein AAGD25_09935 [Cyanobacteria bacterium P01_F01_bin.150]
MDEFREGLELATAKELRELTHLLFHRRFNPLDYVMGVDEKDLPFNDRYALIAQVDKRFRFLAADGVTVLRQTSDALPYRRILGSVCQHFSLHLPSSLSTIALEQEVFLHILDIAYQKLSLDEQSNLEDYFRRTVIAHSFNSECYAELRQQSLRVILKGSGAVMINSVLRPLLLRYLANKVAVQLVHYQMAKKLLVGSSLAVVQASKRQAALQAAKHGAVLNLTRYGAVRSAFAVLGPAMWAWFLADLGWRSIATNYGRIIPAIFSIAQIRLLQEDAR